MTHSGPKVLFWDIETSLQLATVFSLLHNDYLPHTGLMSERYIISACWKWMHEDKVHSVSVLDDEKRFAKDPSDDSYVCRKLHEVLSQADVIVAHNGDSFDTKYVETRMLFHGIDPLPPITSVDTKKVAKGRFYFNSNKLDYLGQFLGLGRKIKTEPDLWMEVLRGNKSAIRSMVVYNKQDVLLLEKVFHKLRPYIPNHVNRELFGGTGCPRCGSTKLQKRGTHKAITKIYQRYQCQGCGGWFRDLKGTKGTTKYRVL